jgi:hypothetical protein
MPGFQKPLRLKQAANKSSRSTVGSREFLSFYVAQSLAVDTGGVCQRPAAPGRQFPFTVNTGLRCVVDQSAATFSWLLQHFPGHLTPSPLESPNH